MKCVYLTRRICLAAILCVIFLMTACNAGQQGNRESIKPDTATPEEQNIQVDDAIPRLEVPRMTIAHDEDGDGVQDMEDILEGARKDAENQPSYRSAYYKGGYPPEDEGVCTDVIWRAFKNAGYMLKDLVDADIRANVSKYPRVGGDPDPNIDFRRVPNLISFFKRHSQVLTTEVIPGNIENLTQWQGGDIVVFGAPCDHIAIVSDRRNKDGVPFIVHNAGPYTMEADDLLRWHEGISPIVYHFRYPKQPVNEMAVSKGENQNEPGQDTKGEQQNQDKKLQGKVICLDPGHQAQYEKRQVPLAPGSKETRPDFATGTQGVATGTPEYTLVLQVALQLRDELQKLGARVVMTRETDDVLVGNVRRAEIANQVKADLFLRIHCDGSANQQRKGISVLYPGSKYITDKAMLDKSYAASQALLDSLIAQTGAKNLGLIKRDDLTGFNWSKVPSTLVEMGFMTNTDEDRLLSQPDYQAKLVKGMAEGVIKFFMSH